MFNTSNNNNFQSMDQLTQSPRRTQDSSGTLKTKISLGKNPSIVHSGPFYLIKEPPEKSEPTAASNLINYYNLEHTYNKFNSKKVKEPLSSFLSKLPGVIDGPGNIDNSSLRSIIEKPPIVGKELMPLNSVQLAGFRLHPGVPLPEKYRFQNTPSTLKSKKKDRKHKYDNNVPPETSPALSPSNFPPGEKKHKKDKRHDDDKERKKRKKEKKRKKQRHDGESTQKDPESLIN